MTSPVKTYQTEMHENLGFFATWLPGDPVDVGDVGVLEGGRFRRVASLEELGVSCDAEETAGKASLQFTSRDGVKLEAGGGAQAAGVANFNVDIEFGVAGAFLFHATGLRLRRLANRVKVGESVVDAYRGGRWKKGWLLVESVHAAKRATVIISEDKSARLQLSAATSIAVPSLSLADPKVTFEVVATKGKLFHTLGAVNLHPLYSCLRLRESFFGAPEVLPVRGSAGATQALSRPGISELLES
jgi:hypothetical protein